MIATLAPFYNRYWAVLRDIIRGCRLEQRRTPTQCRAGVISRRRLSANSIAGTRITESDLSLSMVKVAGRTSDRTPSLGERQKIAHRSRKLHLCRLHRL